MPVYENKKTKQYYWKVSINGQQYKRQNKQWTRKIHAQRDLDAFIESMNRNEYVKNIKFEKMLEAYDGFALIKYKPNTRIHQRNIINKHILPFFKNMTVSNIVAADVILWQQQLIKKKMSNGSYYSNQMLEKIQTTARTVFKFAEDHDYIRKNPFKATVFVRHRTVQRKKEHTILTYPEFKKFMNVIDNQVHRVLFSILYWNGLRIGEAMALTLNDYQDGKLYIETNWDYKTHIITTTKTDESRIVDVPKECQIEIDTLISMLDSDHKNKTTPLIGIVHREPKTTLERAKKRYIDESGVRYFTFHDLRHTHVSTLIDLGWQSNAIAKRLGHSVEMVNNVYGHLFPRRIDDDMDKLNNLSSFIE
ncbi:MULTISPECIES: tyrosine-type recombinase/integrase [unclassified Breznakia]|uniref:tyrosine-type recombinase/integrase n=1 Tax=unclassified Breznakia TaxID=2623764 RepID=UPI0024757408|nr:MULTISPECIES: tyrosine-type recombinase/integrase [unclassified Breznakia]MDH6367167.1 integrase [Breznakia sp. PH1-1]MDH6404413.1 integrase [Breznakia sp. PF1-11]MDH6412122.1 integrase [Breznakia sp. PFB1-11]MDH6414401.1 integrase [Breznakia sp. PFB1-14]MDH6416669.1 integrase [Breznakia sp. PFB1-4]